MFETELLIIYFGKGWVFAPMFSSLQNQFVVLHFQPGSEASFSMWPELWGDFQVISSDFWFLFILL